MAVTWTEEQQKVISLRNRNILVSAAAGSGKTAVLVQRILSKILDKEHPVDIDRLLIMTFTRAAAGEMKERISAALEQALFEEPDNEHLQRQMTLIHTAQITTIDSFCSYIIKNYFHMIGLDPGYRTADEGELKLLREEILEELLEEAYEQRDEAFLELVECYSPGKTDEGLKELIQKVYESSVSHPFPEKWLQQCLEAVSLGWLNRWLGAGLGALKFLLLVSLLICVVEFIDSDNTMIDRTMKEESVLYYPIESFAGMFFPAAKEVTEQYILNT